MPGEEAKHMRSEGRREAPDALLAHPSIDQAKIMDMTMFILIALSIVIVIAFFVLALVAPRPPFPMWSIKADLCNQSQYGLSERWHRTQGREREAKRRRSGGERGEEKGEREKARENERRSIGRVVEASGTLKMQASAVSREEQLRKVLKRKNNHG
eukprot:767223-Hanusia_phi.AAC.2